MRDTDVHIVPGPSAAACLQEGVALGRDQILVHHDLLFCGSLPALDSLEDWRQVRESYLRSLDYEGLFVPFAEEPRDLLTHRERLATAGTITLWVGTGLAEQLLLIWLVAVLRELGVEAGKCQVVQYHHYGRLREVVSVGVLHPSEFKEHPKPTKLEAAGILDATRGWEAVTATEPDALLAFLQDHKPSLPFLQRALWSLLYHYPDQSTGLNAWEHQLLHYVREVGQKATRAVGYTMAHDMEFPEWMADTYLFQRLHRLADDVLHRPLVTLSA